jgi:hydroxypyruvate isomerase
MAGVVPEAGDRREYRSCFLSNIKWAAALAKPRRISLLLEPLNAQDVPGYLIATIADAMSVLEELRLDNLFLQFDAYHTQMSEGRLTDRLRSHWHQIRHIQISGVPGRHEPDDGQEINYHYFLKLLDELGYDGWVGCEYRPRSETRSGLAWAKPWLAPHR